MSATNIGAYALGHTNERGEFVVRFVGRSGWTLIIADQHDGADVLAGAAVGMAAGWWLVEPRPGLIVMPHFAPGVYGLSVRGQF